MMKKSKIILIFFVVALLLSTHSVGRAEVFSSTNFKVVDPVIDAPGGRSTSASFGLLQAFAQFAIGTSTATNFQLNPGFLTFPITSVPTVTPSAGDGQVDLSWTTATGALGWTVSGYNVGQSTTSGGPYTYSSVGNVTISSRTSLTNDTTYYFVVRPEDAFGNSIATSTEVSAAPVAAPAPPADPTPSSPAGGGGGIFFPGEPVTITGSILLEGKAYPNALITVLVDGAQASKFTIRPDSLFSTSVAATSGNHSVSIFAEDISGKRSLTFTFSASVVGSAETRISNIIVPPTIGLSAEEVAPKTLIVDGSSFLDETVSLTFHSKHEILQYALVDVDGLWEYRLDTSILEEGDHLVRAKTILEDETESTFSEARTFSVSANGITIAAKKISSCGVADFNCDDRVNLIDFSILLFNWGTPSNVDTDLSKDGKINITDFSIMLFHWTN